MVDDARARHAIQIEVKCHSSCRGRFWHVPFRPHPRPWPQRSVNHQLLTACWVRISTRPVVATLPSESASDGAESGDDLQVMDIAHQRDYLNALVKESVANGDKQVRQ